VCFCVPSNRCELSFVPRFARESRRFFLVRSSAIESLAIVGESASSILGNAKNKIAIVLNALRSNIRLAANLSRNGRTYCDESRLVFVLQSAFTTNAAQASDPRLWQPPAISHTRQSSKRARSFLRRMRDFSEINNRKREMGSDPKRSVPISKPLDRL
jgi:hypothetical protein